MASDQQNIEQYDQAANNQSLWVMHANELHMASRVLHERVASLRLDSLDDLVYAGLGTVSLMLQGFAIEALLKAYWLSRGNKLASGGKLSLPTDTRDAHQLDRIAVAVSYLISLDERATLERLSLFVTSYGRYPVTKHWQQNPLQPDPHGILRRISWSNEDHAVTESLIQRLRNDT